MADAIVVRTTNPVGSYPAGAELGFASEAKAKSILGDAFEVIRTQAGAPIEAAKKAAAKGEKKD